MNLDLLSDDEYNDLLEQIAALLADRFSDEPGEPDFDDALIERAVTSGSFAFYGNETVH